MAKYDPLYEWLMSKTNAGEVVVSTTFGEIEEILRVPLPPSARTYREWWANDETHSQAIGGWMAAGWKVDNVSLNFGQVTFKHFEQVAFEHFEQVAFEHFEQVTFEQRFNEPVFISEAILQLNRKSVIICPDTCVLLNFVKLEKRSANNSSWIDRFDKWERQLTRCEALLSNKAVGWVIPEQIKREFEGNLDKKFQPFNGAEEEVISGNDLNGSIATLNSELRGVLDGFKDRAKNCRNNIIKKAVLLKEEQNSFIHDAWSLVHSDEFPNKKGNQQMKDSVILSHLCELYRFEEEISRNLNDSQEQAETRNRLFQNHSGINSRIYFWTFDSFDGQTNDESSRFFQKGTRNHIEIKDNILLIHLPTSNPLDSQILSETVPG